MLRHAVGDFYDKLAAEAQLVADAATSSSSSSSNGGGAGGERKRRVSIHAIDMGGRTHFTTKPSGADGSTSERGPSSDAAGSEGRGSGAGAGLGADFAVAAAAASAAAAEATDTEKEERESEIDALIRNATRDVHHAFVIVSPQRLTDLIGISARAQRRCREVMSKGLKRGAQSQLDHDALKRRIETQGTLFEHFVNAVLDRVISELDDAVQGVRLCVCGAGARRLSLRTRAASSAYCAVPNFSTHSFFSHPQTYPFLSLCPLCSSPLVLAAGAHVSWRASKLVRAERCGT